MPVVVVPCPHCGAKLNASDNMAGKKARCNACKKSFRIPGAPVGESGGDADVPMAEAVEELSSPPAPALPSADAFDFSKPTAKSPPAPPPPPKSAPVPPAAKSATDGAKADSAQKIPTAKPAPGSPKAGSAQKIPAVAKPAKSAPAAPALPAKPAQPAPDAPVAKSQPKQVEPLSLDDDDPPAPAKPAPEKPQPAAAPSADPFAFTDEPAKHTKARRHDENEEKDRLARSKRRDEENDEDDAPRKKRSRSDEGDKEGAEKQPAKAKAPAADEPYNPFANFPSAPEPEQKKPKKHRDEENEDEPKNRKKSRAEDDEADETGEKPRYRRPGEQAGSNKMLLFVAVFGVVALGLGIIAAVVYIKNNRKPPEPEVKKEEPPVAEPAALPSAPAKADPKVEPKVDPKPKDKTDPKVEPKGNPKVDPPGAPVRPKDPGPVRPPIALPGNLRTFTLGGLPTKLTAADRANREAGGARTVDAALASVKRVFPPFKPASADTCVLIQTSPPLMGKGEKLALDSYGPAGNRVPTARIEYDGDGAPDPIADVYASPTAAHFLAAVDGKLHVWALADKKKLADGLDPYADKPDHAKAGLAAAFLTTDPNRVVTVSTAGAVHVYDLSTRTAVSEFVPPNGAPGRVALGLSVAKSDENKSVVLAVGGVLYQLEAKEGLGVLRKHDIGGDVVASLGLAVSGTPGRILYAFEGTGGKKERAVLGLPLGASATHILYRLPESAGAPKGALWASETAGGVIVDRGVIWFDDREENKFVPIVLTQPPALGQYYGDERYFWYIVPNPAMAGKCFLVALSVPFNDTAIFEEKFRAKQPLTAVRIDNTGLSK